MSLFHPVAIVLLGAMALGSASAGGRDAHSDGNDLQLSPQLMGLLRAEMRALLSGVQSLAAAIATADWKSAADTGAQMRASYILDQKLTPAQREELGTSLPEYFIRLDSDFHHEAKKLEAAASRHDAQLTAFHYYRLVEACTACHAAYAASRFPGFAISTKSDHVH